MLHFVDTADGSKTLFNPVVGEHYHSLHGALQESQHVFINSGLKHFLDKNNLQEIKILEVGFGTGLNFLLSAAYCIKNNIKLNYTGVELYPLSHEIISQTGYDQYILQPLWDEFISAYPIALRQFINLNDNISVRIETCGFRDFHSAPEFNIIYFDAFAVSRQPEMWSFEALAHILEPLKLNGVFVTYAITGNLKRNVKSLGLKIEKLSGAIGKREMLRATK